MKTTFKEVFRELDDEVTDIEFNMEHVPDIDIDKIKGEVFMRINENNGGKKPLGNVLYDTCGGGRIGGCDNGGRFGQL